MNYTHDSSFNAMDNGPARDRLLIYTWTFTGPLPVSLAKMST